MIAFDIETESLPLETIKAVCPPWDPESIKHPGSFDESAVKLGRMKDEAKIAAKIEAERQKHAAAVEKYIADRDSGELKYWAGIQEKAALSAVTGSICAIGVISAKGMQMHLAVDGVTEPAIIKSFWNVFRAMHNAKRLVVGWNINQFDLPFLVQRSFVHRIEVPAEAFTASGYASQTFRDLMQVWAAGARGSGAFASLDVVAKACGLPGKSDDCQGKDFAAKLRSEDETERQVAVDYLKGDLEATFKLAELFGIG